MAKISYDIITDDNKKITTVIRNGKRVLPEIFLFDLASGENPKYKEIIKEYYKIKTLFDNPNRKKIYDIIQKENLNIQQIAKKVGLSYQNTFAHVKLLESYNLVKTDRQDKGSVGRERIISKGKKTIEQIREDFREKYKEISTTLEKRFNKGVQN